MLEVRITRPPFAPVNSTAAESAILSIGSSILSIRSPILTMGLPILSITLPILSTGLLTLSIRLAFLTMYARGLCLLYLLTLPAPLPARLCRGVASVGCLLCPARRRRWRGCRR
jgi:hypothetical protein